MPMPFSSVDPYKDYSTLSFRDLVEARDFYHRQLMRKQNVIGTALGRFLQRKHNTSKTGKKTLSNTEVTKYSWPCLIVFVKQWADNNAFGSGEKQIDPSDFIPQSIEMPDGRVVPLCVIEAPPIDAEPMAPVNPVFPDNWMGGGYPMIAEVDGKQEGRCHGGCTTRGQGCP